MDPMDTTILAVHLAATGLMAGVIWFVQMVHYPLLAAVPASDFVAYERSHVARTGRLVGPLMLLEAASAAMLLAETPVGVPAWMPWAGGGLLAVIWISTFAVQVPLHRRLETGREEAAIARLVASNWVRTVGWTARAGLAGWMLEAAVGAAATGNAP